LRDEGVREQGDVRELERGLHAERVGVRLRLDEAREAVAGRAADARARGRALLVAADAERDMEGPGPVAREVLGESLDARLVADRGVRIGRARPWLRGVLAAGAVHVIQPLALPGVW